MEDLSEIQNFYKNCNIFITGGTGFIGKILVEKLLRSTDVATIYLLIREKRGKSIYERLDEMLDDVIFDVLKTYAPKYRNKVEAISGDCSLSNLGLTITDRQKLILNTNIVFHGAATVKINEGIQLAYNINVNGTKCVLELCKEMENIKCLMHISTLFSHCYRDDIEEKFYETVDYEDVGLLLEKMSKQEAEEITLRLVKPWPNTYSYTKALAESLIRNKASDIPAGVFRPAIVVSTYKEPIPGWTDNLYGANGTCAGVLAGSLRVVRGEKELIGELVPVDTCVSGLIAAAWDVGTQKVARTPIYNYVSSLENPITWKDYMDLVLKYSKDCPSQKSMWCYYSYAVSNPIVFSFLKVFYHIIPGIFIDFVLVITGNRPRVLKMYEKIHRYTDIIIYFSSKQWIVSNDNTKKLWKRLSIKDKELFPMSITTVHWLEYFKSYTKGMRKYMLKDPDSTLEKAKIRHQKFVICDRILNTLMLYFVVSLIWSIFCSGFECIFSWFKNIYNA